VLTGSIKTGSAGLFITFLAFAIIVFSLSSVGRSTPNVPHVRTDHKKSRQAFKALVALFIGTVASACAAAFGYPGLAFLAMFFGFLLIPTGVAYFSFLEQE
jgi:hypothetical protein